MRTILHERHRHLTYRTMTYQRNGRQDKALPRTRTMQLAMMNKKTNKSPSTLASSKRRKTLAMSLLVRVSSSLTVWRRLKTTTITSSSLKCKKRDRTSQLIWLP